MSIVLKTSNRLAWIHRGAVMSLQEGLLRWKVWRQDLADSALVNGMGNSMPEQIRVMEG